MWYATERFLIHVLYAIPSLNNTYLYPPSNYCLEERVKKTKETYQTQLLIQFQVVNAYILFHVYSSTQYSHSKLSTPTCR